MVILRMLEREGLRNHIVVVTRWFGGNPCHQPAFLQN